MASSSSLTAKHRSTGLPVEVGGALSTVSRTSQNWSFSDKDLVALESLSSVGAASLLTGMEREEALIIRSFGDIGRACKACARVTVLCGF